MMTQFQSINFRNPLDLLIIIATIIVIICTLIIIIAIFINFIEAKQTKIEKKKKSIVATGTMFLFYCLYYVSIRFRLGIFYLSETFQIIAIILGLIILVIGCIFNIKGRLFLGENWADQINIYNDHKLVNKGPYKYVRHPLYASLIWMFLGGSLIYQNYLSFILNLCVFIPFMYYRAKQEEELLIKKFKKYSNYKKNIGMFFPKIKLN